MVTHDSQLAKRADRILILCDGRLISEELSRAFPNVGDLVLAAMDESREEIKLKPGESISKDWFGKTWFGLIKTGSIIMQSRGVRKLFEKETSYASGEIIELGNNEKPWIAMKESVLWLVRLKEKSRLSSPEVDQVNYFIRSRRKEKNR